MKVIWEAITLSLSIFLIVFWWNHVGKERKTRFNRNAVNHTGIMKTSLVNKNKTSMEEVYKNTSERMFLHVPESNVQTLKLQRSLDRNTTYNFFTYLESMKPEYTDSPQISDLNSYLETSNKFHILLVPHSHNEPGWKETYATYYNKKTYTILKNVVNCLSNDPRLKFIWVEVSFLSYFWYKIDSKMKIKLLKLLGNGQLEIVTGGWVMNDEANTHYFGILNQLIEGHQWLMNEVDYRPNNSWAIDVVGHNPTMPYFLKKMGMQNLVIDRLPYLVKQHFVENTYMEFFWRQMWDTSKLLDVLTLVLPFHYGQCSFGCDPSLSITGDAVNDSIVKALQQLLGYARSYHSNVLLVPVGGDFAYATQEQAKATFEKYTLFINHVNSHFAGRVEARFATLNEFFEAHHSLTPRSEIPVVLGDFCTYADTYFDYWSGIYSSRPFYKRKDRIVLNYLRAAEILFTLAWSSKKNPLACKWLMSDDAGFYYLLLEGRRSVGIFQHHQAITGTSRHSVMLDYAKMINNAVHQFQLVMQHSIRFLLYNHKLHPYESKNTELYLHLSERYKTPDRIAEALLMVFEKYSDTRRVVIFNSLTWKTQQMVCVCVNNYKVKVTSSNGTVVMSQTSPLFLNSKTNVTSVYFVCFWVEVEALSIDNYFITLVKRHSENKSNFLSNITIYRDESNRKILTGSWRVNMQNHLKSFALSNQFLTATFDKYGLLKTLSLNKRRYASVDIRISFSKYLESGKSGVYVSDFYEEHLLSMAHVVRVIDGPLYSQVDISIEFVKHSVRIYKYPGVLSLGLEINNYVDIDDFGGAITMRIESTIKSGRVFYTDLNGLQMIRREFFESFRAGNYYPMSSAAYIEDDQHRLTLLSGQPGGFTSSASGKMEVTLDRRMSTRDEKGLDEGILDNVPYSNLIFMILEEKIPNCEYMHKDHPSGVLSPYGIQLSYTTLYPLIILYTRVDEDEKLLPHFSEISTHLGHDIHLVKMQSLFENGEPKAGVILHRFAVNKCFETKEDHFVLHKDNINVSSLFPSHFENKIIRTSLSFLHDGERILKDDVEYISPMDMKAYLMT